MGVVRVVVPEGLAAGAHELSGAYRAVIERLAVEARPEDQILLAPGNSFGGPHPEEAVAADVLAVLRPDLCIERPERAEVTRYLDTLDNARVLRAWLARQERWPLPAVVLHCNAVHARRSRLLFRLTGYVLSDVIMSRPGSPVPRSVPRLWFMGVPVVHHAYELAATVWGMRAVLPGGRFRHAPGP